MAQRVLIVDDHPEFRSLARRLLERGGYDVVGEADDGRSARDAVRALEPDVVLLDVQLPDDDGFSVAASLHATPYPPEVVLVSARSASDYGGRLTETRLPFIGKAELSAPALAAALAGVG